MAKAIRELIVPDRSGRRKARREGQPVQSLPPIARRESSGPGKRMASRLGKRMTATAGMFASVASPRILRAGAASVDAPDDFHLVDGFEQLEKIGCFD
ncbi:MAG TPA: hypothetical protein VF723_17455 [Pyrinomonadaceae bacterium]